MGSKNSIQYLINMTRSIFFARANCEEELCGLIPSRSPISLCERPSNTESLKISRFPSGNSSIADSNNSSSIFFSLSSSSLNTSFPRLDKRILLFSVLCRNLNERFLTIVIIHPSNFELSFSELIEVKMMIKASCKISSAVLSSAT